jgi:hypothetical protein
MQSTCKVSSYGAQEAICHSANAGGSKAQRGDIHRATPNRSENDLFDNDADAGPGDGSVIFRDGLGNYSLSTCRRSQR